MEESQPERKDPAPGPLEVVRRFANSLDVDEGTDELGDPVALGAWLVEAGLLEPEAAGGLGADDLERVVSAREALRALLAAHAGDPDDPGALTVLNAVAERATLVVRFADDGHARLEPAAGGVDAALGRLLAIAQTAMVDGTWSRLKVCRWDTCRWAFYDASKNRSGSWCSMAVCGNRAKAASYRQRRRSEGQSGRG